MANSQPTRIYISAMETDVEGKPRFDPQAADLLARLSQIGYAAVWEKQHRDYDVIEKDIAASDALLAVVDTTWASSTWMASEVTWAMGDFGAMETSNPRMTPIPVFLYPVAPDAPLRFPFNYRESVLLDRDIDLAIAQIRKRLPLRSEVG